MHICTIVKTGALRAPFLTIVHIMHQFKIPYTRSRCTGQLTTVQFLSYLFRICTPDDGSLEPKHVAPCLLLSKIK